MKKGQSVFYAIPGGKIRARLVTQHKDGTVTLVALFSVGADGKDVPGYLGYRYRMSSSDLLAA